VRLEEADVLQRKIGTRIRRLSLRAGRAERSGELDGAQACMWERLFGVVDEYLREDRPR
jgi:hypothetical protein